MTSPYYEPRARWGHGAVEVKGKVFVWGGEDSDGNPYPASLVEVFDIHTGYWEQQSASGVGPIGVIYSAYTTIGEKLYTFSGRGKGRTYYNTLHQLNLKSMKWKKLAYRNPSDAPTPRRGCTMIAYSEDKLVMYGGLDENNRYSSDLHVFDLRDGVWLKCQVSSDSECPSPRGYGTFFKVDEFKAILFAGATSKGRKHDAYYLDMPRQLSHPWKWTELHVLPESPTCPARSGHGASIVRHKAGHSKVKGVLIFGGLDNNFSPLCDAWFLDLNQEKATVCSWKQIKLPDEVGGRCDASISVISSTSSQSAHVLLYGGQHKWGEETIAETTLMVLFTSGRRAMTLADSAMITDPVKWNERIFLLQTIEKLKVEMSKGKTVKRKAVSVLFVGPPQTGKTTLINRIQNPELVALPTSSSTPVAKGPVHVTIAKAVPTMAVWQDHEWITLSFSAEKSSLISSALPTDIHEKTSVVPGHTTGYATTGESVASDASQPTTTNKQSWQGIFQRFRRQRRHRQHLTRSDSVLSTSSAISVTFETPEDMYREFLLLQNRKEAKDSDRISLQLLDTGGQPEFMEVLPLLLTCPSLIVLVFNMNIELTDRYTVEYLSPDGSKAVPYESSFTVEEVMLQALSSVSHSVTQVPSSASQHLFEEERIQSVAVFVGTHLDQVSGDKVDKINDLLSSKLQNVSVPGCKIVSYRTLDPSPSYRSFFALNNTIPHDPQLLMLRNVLTDVLDEEFRSCEVPRSWLMFYLSVRSTQARILSLQHCRKIAGECGISEDRELRLTLWYLSKHWGVFRYFPEVPGLEKVVIVDIQILFDAITKLIVRAFEFSETSRVSNADISIKESGRFPLTELEHLLKMKDFKSHQEVSVDNFIKLLEHMHVIASVCDDTNNAKEYFFPCVLKSYPVETLVPSSEQAILSLLVTFECGYCPLGMFNALALSLSKCSTWRMARFNRLDDKTRLYRNKLVYYVGEAEDKLTLIAHPKYFEVQLERMVKSMKNINQVCNDVRVTIEQSLEDIKSRISSFAQSFHHFAFHCQVDHSSVSNIAVAGVHPAVVQMPLKEVLWPSNVRCSITEHISPLSVKQLLWFGNESSLEAIEDIDLECVDNKELGDADSDSLHAVLHELVEVIRWKELGSTLGLKQSTLERIEMEQVNIIYDCIREMIIRWLNRNDLVQEPSWRSLVRALNTGLVNHSDIALKVAVEHRV